MADRNWMSNSGRTWIGPEEDAYNTPSGTHWGSGRGARVLCADGKIRTATLGIPDSFTSIPAHISRGGKIVVGYVSRIGNYHVEQGFAKADLDEWGFMENG